MSDYVYLVTVAFIMGVVARICMMRVDFNQYPTYPQGLISHITLGIIAAALGSVAIPAFVEKQFSAVTFLALAAQQFRDVRNMERQSLDNIEETEIIPRGTAYIEDIAKAFEARNYMAILCSLVTGMIFFVFSSTLKYNLVISVTLAVFGGSILALVLKRILTREKIDEIARVESAELSFNESLLSINGVVLMNVGDEDSRKRYLEGGIAVEIFPKHFEHNGVIANLGQRQAIAHNCATQLGIKKDVDEPEFTLMIRRNFDNNSLVMVIIPILKDIELLKKAVRDTPVIESAKSNTFFKKGV